MVRLPPINQLLSSMHFSQFGNKFTRQTGISRLMEDMGRGLRTPGTVMLGGVIRRRFLKWMTIFSNCWQKCSKVVR